MNKLIVLAIMAAVITTLYCFVNGEEPTKNYMR